ncbi:signal peptidase I [Sorangium cellulosum]|uniref:signal peptidase I n=1 Tax=Sorangium TaxID=39643 RepID=UPI0009D6EAC9|nr:signal peptidase I [Sorangium cellulosum]
MSEPGSPPPAAEVATACLPPDKAELFIPRSDRAFARRAYRTVAPLARSLLKVVAALVILTMGRSTLADQYHVPTGSMWPTIAPGDRILVDKVAYGLRVPLVEGYLLERSGPRAGDVVLFADPRGGSTLLVKRVIALAGQTVMLRAGVLYVDGAAQPVEQLGDGTRVEHLGRVTHAAGEPDFAAFGPVVVPADHLFVMGDNRAASLDSRVMGAVPRELVRGRVLRVVYHHDAAGFDLSRALLSVD